MIACGCSNLVSDISTTYGGCYCLIGKDSKTGLLSLVACGFVCVFDAVVVFLAVLFGNTND